MDKSKNVFISHFGKDDKHIQKLKDLLNEKGYSLRNGSIDSSKPNDAKNEEYIKSLLRDGIKWAGTTVVLIGPETHTRWWVDWEIEQSNKQGNRVVGVYIEGASGSEVPENFKEFGDALVGWNSEKIIGAIEGRINNFENPDGTEHQGFWASSRGNC